MIIHKNEPSARAFYPAKKRAAFISLMLFGLACCWLLISISSVSAQSLLDPTFNGNGKVTTQIVSVNSKANDSILQPDGKIIVVGSAAVNVNFPQGYQIAVARYNTDGSLDSTFDGDGKLTTTIDAFKPSAAIAVALQSDGKIVVVGRVDALPSDGSPDAVIVRYNSNGSLDTTFGTDGIRLIANFDVQNAYDVASDVAVQADGKIVIAAGTIASGFQGFVVARLNTDGSFDTNFGTGGYTRTQFDNQTVATPKLALTADGKIILTGNAVGAQLIRYNSNGTLDGSFGTGGIINNAGGDSIRLDSSGKIVTTNNTSQVNTIVRRYNTNGTADTTFGTNGATTITFTNADGNLSNPYDLAIQPDGKIVVGGTIRLTTSANQDFALARLNANGSLDTLFGFNGRFTTDIQGEDIGHSILIQPDGKIILAGESGGGFTVARFVSSVLNNACRPISDFDGDGKSDLAYFNNSGDWKHLNSTGGGATINWGLNTDQLVPADYNGDCRTDYAVFRDGNWYIRTAGVNSTQIYYQFGRAGDIPVPGDYDGDDLTDPAVFRNGIWYILGTRAGFYAVQFGLGTDKPVPGDYDGDGKTDIAVNRAGDWYIQNSQTGFAAVSFGYADDNLVPADYDGDGKIDIAVFRPSNSTWYIQRSQAGFTGVVFGLGTDLPIPADYDGDGKADIAVFRNGYWYLLQTTNGYVATAFGSAADKPIESVYNH